MFRIMTRIWVVDRWEGVISNFFYFGAWRICCFHYKFQDSVIFNLNCWFIGKRKLWYSALNYVFSLLIFQELFVFITNFKTQYILNCVLGPELFFIYRKKEALVYDFFISLLIPRLISQKIKIIAVDMREIGKNLIIMDIFSRLILYIKLWLKFEPLICFNKGSVI